MLSIMSPLCAPEEQAPSSPLSTPDEPAPSSPEFLVQRSTMSPTVATTEIPKTDRTQVEAKEIRLSNMPPVTLDDSNMHIKTNDITEMNIREDFDNRPSKKAKISESGVLETSPMSPTMSASNQVSECFESIVPESDNQIDHEPLQSPPSPSSSTLTPVLILHDVKGPDPNKGIKVDETYDYLPQDYTLTDHDLCAHIAIESSLRKQLLVQIDGSCVLQNQLMCLLNEKEWVNDDIKLPINANNTHWYLAVVNTKKHEVQVLDSLCWNSDRDDLAHTLRGVQFHLDLLKSQNLVKDNWKDIDLTEWKITEQLQKAIQKDSYSCGLFEEVAGGSRG
ncbi:uncharacterized protein LOC119295207 isoform X1 [Triticum dicoccoides]|uniref:uncharacterized protein LOC119295207 isoform X1 n=2 Tax=Triticum dicoccoides TaxID=85692 RepID=UPI0003D46EAF|nr:uncharacterized protein LOC119295207 isoform X1 [Triticum dicoccoides]XP_037429467.1 uncharacterized protein LOC119295207 isoform X1 [Triticum dicoccoides]XP_037429468.1 uncharacterized protein LOC119295207 isoform X1 [Triticum dicoccoides]XP_044368610.1 uncharacterized protein LOC123091230 isoform X1 [Triticum aestivum]XP_044368611.1 uncharacterized protein LOC123091230 isoform X1 [Triticum aestivum]XP_044368612.1 uncharacterized protein LOC123091230 isoform X1 [Triticum aestivum]